LKRINVITRDLPSWALRPNTSMVLGRQDASLDPTKHLVLADAK